MTEVKFIQAPEAVKAVRNGDHIHLSSIASVPQILIQALSERRDELQDVHFHHFHTEGPAPYAEGGPFFDQGFFVGPNVRENVALGEADYIPVNLFE
ncbi:MAG: 4-hydroxybutyrate CoA-transferase, partial [Bacteroidales bacterium]|nr:4-hydroxybutyrate CoA-transferase [Bacteroidales bacterium]